jgi:phosphocarrier protein
VKEREVEVVNRLGLHARAAARFVHLANTFQCRISVSKGGSRVDGKSILGLLTLAAAQGSRLRLAADGEDENEALEGLAALVRGKFEEET